MAQLKEMIKDMPPVVLPSKLPVHPYQPYVDLMLHDLPRTVEPNYEMKILKERPNNQCKEITENCPKCGKDWLDHEFGVPAPYCP